MRAYHYKDKGVAGRIPLPPSMQAVHFPRIVAWSRALPSISCMAGFSCKENGEVHAPTPEVHGFRRALPPKLCRRPCTSQDFLHEFSLLQGFGRSARRHARKVGKCTPPRPKRTSSCKETREVHVACRATHSSVLGQASELSWGQLLPICGRIRFCIKGDCPL